MNVFLSKCSFAFLRILKKIHFVSKNPSTFSKGNPILQYSESFTISVALYVQLIKNWCIKLAFRDMNEHSERIRQTSRRKTGHLRERFSSQTLWKSANSYLLQDQQDLDYLGNHDYPCFPSFFWKKLIKIMSFFRTYLEKFNIFWEGSNIRCSPRFPAFLCTRTVFVLYWWTYWMISLVIKTTNSLKKFFSAGSTPTLLQDMLLQTLTAVEMKSRKILRKHIICSHATYETWHWAVRNCVTVASLFASIWCYTAPVGLFKIASSLNTFE